MTSSNGNIFRVTVPLWGGIHRSPANSPHKGQWRGPLMFSLLCAWTNGSANNRDAGDLQRHHTHYDVVVMVNLDMDMQDIHSLFCGRYFHMKLPYLFSNFTEMWSQWSNWWLSSTGSDNGLVPNRRQVIIWTKDGLVDWCTYAAFSVDELTHWDRDKMAVILQTTI